MKSKLINLLLVLVFVAGLSLLLYPTIADAYKNNVPIIRELVVSHLVPLSVCNPTVSAPRNEGRILLTAIL